MIHKVSQVPTCTSICKKPRDPHRHTGFLRIKSRVFYWLACPKHECCQICEWPERTSIENEYDEEREFLAIELLAQILKGQRPWKDLELVEKLLPEAR